MNVKGSKFWIFMVCLFSKSCQLLLSKLVSDNISCFPWFSPSRHENDSSNQKKRPSKSTSWFVEKKILPKMDFITTTCSFSKVNLLNKSLKISLRTIFWSSNMKAQKFWKSIFLDHSLHALRVKVLLWWSYF